MLGFKEEEGSKKNLLKLLLIQNTFQNKGQQEDDAIQKGSNQRRQNENYVLRMRYHEKFEMLPNLSWLRAEVFNL